jgi:hypothetical protein
MHRTDNADAQRGLTAARVRSLQFFHRRESVEMKKLLLATALALTPLLAAAAPALKSEGDAARAKIENATTCAEVITIATDTFHVLLAKKNLPAGLTMHVLLGDDYEHWKRHPAGGYSAFDWSRCSGAPEAETLRPTAAEKAKLVRLLPGTVYREDDLADIVVAARENELRFDRDYTGKQFSGTAAFEGAEAARFGAGYTVVFDTVVCHSITDAKQLDKASDMIAQQNVSVVGTIDAVNAGRVVLRDCRFS